MEIEQKYIVRNGDFDSVRRKLADMGFARGKEKHQIDVYFLKSDQPDTDLHFKADGLPAYLRLRHDVIANTFSFDIKLIRHWEFYDEYETRIADQKSFKDCEYILSLLGYKRGCIIDKRREPWNKNEIEVVLDDIAGLGKFIEIEILADEKDKDAAAARIEEIANELELSPDDRMKTGYVDLWSLKKSGTAF